MRNYKIAINHNMEHKEDIRCLIGEPRGKDQYENLEIDKLEKTYDVITITIPKSIINMSNSFFLGMFGDTIRKYKTRQNFLNKFHFVANDLMMSIINNGINDALNEVDLIGG